MHPSVQNHNPVRRSPASHVLPFSYRRGCAFCNHASSTSVIRYCTFPRMLNSLPHSQRASTTHARTPFAEIQLRRPCCTLHTSVHIKRHTTTHTAHNFSGSRASPILNTLTQASNRSSGPDDAG